MYLLDTVALSETRKPAPNHGYVSWLEKRELDETYIGSPTIGELFHGVSWLRDSAARERILRWATEIVEIYANRIIAFDASAARVWGEARGAGYRRGRPLTIIDSQLAAIAWVNGLTVVTRDTSDFNIPEFEELKVISPWT